MAKSWTIVSTPSAAATGMEASRAARTRSLAIITGRRRTRSHQAPASRPISRNAADSSAVSTPTSKVLACREITATRGIASSET